MKSEQLKNTEILISDKINLVRKYGGVLVTQDSLLDLKSLSSYETWYCQIENPRLVSCIGILMLLAFNYDYKLKIVETNAYGQADWCKLSKPFFKLRNNTNDSE